MTDVRRIGVRVPPTDTEVEAMDAAFELLSTGARRVGDAFTEADDDWWPQYLVLTKRQGTLITPDTFAPGEKRAVTRTVAAFARRVGAVCVAHLASSWVVRLEDVGEERLREVRRSMELADGSTEGIPERREVVLIHVYTASAWRAYVAAIRRQEAAPPTLDPFKLDMSSADMKPPDRIEGAMVDPLREAVWRTG